MIALLVVVLTPLSMFVASFIARKTHHYFTEQARVRGQQTALINELIEGQKVVQSFGHEAASLSDFDCINDELGRVSLNATFFSSLTNPPPVWSTTSSMRRLRSSARCRRSAAASPWVI